MEIKLNDILRLTDEEIARTKVRFNADYDGEDAIDVYKRDPERVNSSGFLWRVKQQMFSVGQIGVCLLLVRRDLWLLTTVKTITRELGVKHGVNYEAEEVARLKPYFNRVFVRWHRTRKQQNQCVWFGKLMDEFVVHSIEDRQGQVCIASRGKVKKLCTEVKAGASADVSIRALRGSGGL